jgi:hypothetical protein
MENGYPQAENHFRFRDIESGICSALCAHERFRGFHSPPRLWLKT